MLRSAAFLLLICTIHLVSSIRADSGSNSTKPELFKTTNVTHSFEADNATDKNLRAARPVSDEYIISFVLASFWLLGIVWFCGFTLVFLTIRCCVNCFISGSSQENDSLKWKEHLENIFVRTSTETKNFKPLFDTLNAKDMLIDPTELAEDRYISYGSFGTVLKAFYKNRKNDGETGKPIRNEVAIKIQNREGAKFHEIIVEAEIMSRFDHPNVMNLIGVTLFDNCKPALVLPFMNGKDLKSHVANGLFTVRQLIDYAIQIVNGMIYLSDRFVVHGDLALRNCMIQNGTPPLVKITDFSCTTLTHKKNDRSFRNFIVLPYKWMAPESLKSLRFSMKSDVYSFGVTLWELMARGKTPFEGLTPTELITELDAGHRPELPEFCPLMIYILMGKCWTHDPKQRPTFREVSYDLYETIQWLENLDSLERWYERSFFRENVVNEAKIYDV